MADQNRLHAYQEAKAAAEGRKQAAIAEAQTAHRKAVERHRAGFDKHIEEAQARFEVVKTLPVGDRKFLAAREAFDRVRSTNADPKPANDAHDRAVRAIEAAHREELRRLGEVHGVTVL